MESALSPRNTFSYLHMMISRQFYEASNYLQAELHRPLLMKIVNDVTAVSREQIMSKSRKRKTVEARQLFIWVGMNHRLFHSLKECGKYMGGLDHSTIIHTEKKIRNILSSSELARRGYEKLINDIDTVERLFLTLASADKPI